MIDARASSLAYLRSDQALKDVERDPYWPKWDSPWWHMLLLHEMGETQRIPEQLIKAFISRLNRIPLKIFPIHPDDRPVGLDPHRDSACHCQLGNVYQVLATWTVDVDKELPWIRPWLLRYQMQDGGMNCDSKAYLVKDEVPSSMVGTIAAFEAILFCTPRPWTAEEKIFLDRAAQFLMERQLTLGSSSVHNAEERESARNWLKLCFPRFYLYDALRGLNALLIWGEQTKQPVPVQAYSTVVSSIEARFPDGNIRSERLSYQGVGSIQPSINGDWVRRQPAALFPLLAKASEPGEISPFLSRQWAEAKNRIKKLKGQECKD